MFRRRSQPALEETPQVTKPGGKGRPTPKRSEAEKRRRQPIAPPKNRKEAYRRVREKQADDRRHTREGMARGEEKYLQARDRGPVRKFARDYVDSRRTVGSYLMWALMGVLVLTFVPTVFTRLLMLIVPPIMLAFVLVESTIISRRVKAGAAERFPDENIKGVGLYAATRAMQIRRLRMPKPQVQLGDKKKV